jgi:hypothetical protein
MIFNKGKLMEKYFTPKGLMAVIFIMVAAGLTAFELGQKILAIILFGFTLYLAFKVE